MIIEDLMSQSLKVAENLHQSDVLCVTRGH